MKDNIKQIVKLGFFISLSAILLFIAFRNINFSLVLEELKNARYSWLIIALAASVLAFIIRARRWILLIKPLGYEPSLRSAYHALMTGYLFNFAAPRLGELTRCAALGRKEKIPVDKLFGTVIAERAFDLVSMLVIMLIMIAGRSRLMNSFFKDNVFSPLGGKIASTLTMPLPAVIIILLLVLAAATMVTVYRRRLRKIKLFTRIGDILKGIYSGLKSFTAMKDRLEFIIHT
ncbi:MAG: lysylphosphatidylglycerol synthase transmembrane domain-containing protein, partial [Bacteroidales bacterium]